MSAGSQLERTHRWMSARLDFFWTVFVTSFCMRLPLPALLILVIGLATGALGDSFGIPDLVYHDRPLLQFLGGVSLSLLAAGTLLVGFLLYNADLVRRAQKPHAPVPESTPPPHPGHDHLPRPPRHWLAEILAVLACIASTMGVLWDTSYLQGTIFLVVLLSAALGLLFLRWANHRHHEFLWAPGRWPFFHYSLGIVGWLFAFIGLTWMGTLTVAVAANLLGLGNRELPELTRMPEPGQYAYVLPLIAGLVNGLLLCWAVVAVSMTDGLNLVLARCTRAFAGVVQAPARGRKVGDYPPPSTSYYHTFLVMLVGLGILCYLGVTAMLASVWGDWLTAFAVGLAVAIILLAVVQQTFPTAWHTLGTAILRNTQLPNEKDYRYHSVAVVLFLTVFLFQFTLAMLPDCNSPITTACFFLYVFVALYGLIAYMAHRILPILLGALVLMVIFGGVPPYKMRFDGLPGDRGAFDEQNPGIVTLVSDGEDAWHEKVLDLTKHARRDTDLQRKFDALLGELDQASESRAVDIRRQIAALKVEARGNRVRPLIDPRTDEMLEPVSRTADDGTPNESLRLPLAPDDLGLLRADPTSTGEEPLAVVSVSGGGLRSAVWTLRVLQHLEKGFARQGIDFPARVRLICGASGGMLGAAYYVATLPPQPRRLETIREIAAGQVPARWEDMNRHRAALARDFLTPLVQRGVVNDIPAFFSPYPNLRDRGKALEEAWGKHLGEADPSFGAGKHALDVTFADLRRREIAGCCPSLAFSPMLVEDGRRLLVSNLDLRYVAANTGNRVGVEAAGRGSSVAYSLDALELFRLFPESKEHFKLSTAVRMSASFPYFSPAVSLPTTPRRRVVDAGYYDNYGVNLAAAWLFSARNADWIERNASRIVLIQIRDADSDSVRRLDEIPSARTNVLGRALEEISTPPEGMYNGLFAAASFRNDGQLELLSAYFRTNRWKRAAESFQREVQKEFKQEHQGGAAQLRQMIEAPRTALAGPARDQLMERVTGFVKEKVNDPNRGAQRVTRQARRLMQVRSRDPEGQAALPHEQRYFTTVTFEFGGKAALSWYLSRADNDRIDRAIRPDDGVPKGATNVRATLDDLIRWWKPGSEGAQAAR